MEKKLQLLFPSALVASLVLPFIGIGGLVHLVVALIQLRKGQNVHVEKHIARASAWIQFSIYFGLLAICLVGLAFFILGGDLIFAMGSIY